MRRGLTGLVALALLVGCGEEEEQPAREEAGGKVAEVGQATTVSLGGLAYRVTRFRQLNPRIPPDRSLYEGPPAAQGNGLYGAFVRVCNDGSEPRTSTDAVHLEDAFGERFAPRPERVAEPLRYRSVELRPGTCLPAADSSAEQTWRGVGLVFEVPVRDIRERPIVLEIRSQAGSERARIELDV